MQWSDKVNGFLYEFVGLVLQASQAHNVMAPGGCKYNVPSEKITIDNTVAEFYLNVISYTYVAITGVDDFNNDNMAIRETFDFLVENTQEVTPACELCCSLTYFCLTDPPQSSRNCLVTGVRMGATTLDGYNLTTVELEQCPTDHVK